MEWNGEFKLINKKKLCIDPTYQRDLANRKGIATIIKEFDWASFGTLSVSFRDNKYYVMDGQRRKQAMIQDPTIKEVPCVVFKKMTLKSEAQAYGNINTGRVSIGAIDSFKARIIAEDSVALSINKLITEHGWRVSKSAAPMALNSIAAVEYCWKTYGHDVVGRVLDFCADLHEGVTHQTLLKALCLLDYTLVCTRNETIYDHKTKLMSYHLCIKFMANKRAECGDVAGGSYYVLNARALNDLINKGKRKKFTLNFDTRKRKLEQR